MPSLNHVVLIGRLTRDPELRYTTSETAVANFTIAVDRRVKAGAEKEADFIRITVWSKQAENCANYLAKGRLVAVEGRLQVRNYEKDGQRHTITDVVAENVQFLSPKNNSESVTPPPDILPEVPGDFEWPKDPPF